MDFSTFFAKFDLFADAPDAVAKMRELVLHLAVQGRLVENTPDNPVSAEQIASDKARFLRELRIRSHPETPQSSQDDFPFALPMSWHAVSLGDLAYSCPTSYGEDPAPSFIKAGVVKVGNIDNQGGFKGSFSERGFLAEEFESLVARRGDLMVVKSSGSAENVHSGKAALCTAEHDGKIVGTNFVLRLRLLGTPALPEYVWRVLTSRYSRAWIEGTVQTMTYPNLKWSDFARLPIPLPPLAEQKRIVAKVDELMALCDRLEAQQQERETRHAALARASLARFAEAPTPANLDFLFHSAFHIPPSALRKSILTLAVQGKLVPQNPNDEPAEELLERLAREMSPENRRRQVASLPALDVESLQYELPESWTWARFRDVAIIASNLVKPDDFLDFTHLAPDNIEKGNGVLLPCSTVREDKVISSNHRFYPGQIIYSKIRPNLAKVVVVDFEGLCSADMYPIDALIDADYLQRYMLSESFLVQAVKTDTRVAMPKINQTELNALAVPVPPLAEQRRIVAKVDELIALVDALETQLAASRTTAANLLSALVAELTGTPNNSKISVPSASTNGRRGRPRKQ